MSRLMFLRHTETDLVGSFCGHADPLLNARGWAQVEDLLRELREERFDAVYTSDLLRARDLAETFGAASGVPCHSRTGLREICFGAWEGLTWKQIEARDPELSVRWLREFPHLPAPRGESFEAFEMRVRQELTLLMARHPRERLLVVTHAGVMRSVLRAWCGVSDEEAWARTKEYGCRFTVESLAAGIWVQP